MNTCFGDFPEIQERIPVFILLERMGDIIQMLPAFKAIHDRSGEKPVLITSIYCDSVLDGVSYVHRKSMRLLGDLLLARKIAEEMFGGGTILQCHGSTWGVDCGKYHNYGSSMWERAGFTFNEMINLPLVFDRRNRSRETELIKLLGIHKKTKPVILYNFTGISSPFPYSKWMQNILNSMNGIDFVDIGKVRAFRIFDLLGLYDRANGLITIDTATLHLAPASKVRYIAFTQSGWTGSVPKGNCVLNVEYPQFPSMIGEITGAIKQLCE